MLPAPFRPTLRRLAAAAALGLALGAAPSFAGPRGGPPLPLAAAGRIDRAAEFVEKVNRAIDRGVEWLRSAQSGDGTFPEYAGYPMGTDALAYHTLRVCGVPKDDPACLRLWTALQRQYQAARRSNSLQTYTAALLLMAIAEHGERETDSRADREVRLTEADRSWAEELTRWIVRGQNPDGTWTYASGDGTYARNQTRPHDNSNTQYAMLGLKAAARCGIRIESRVWKASLDHFLETQDPAGPDVLRFDPDATKPGRTSAGGARDRARGWGYGGQGGAYGSMTAGGVGSVVICRSEMLGTSAMPPPLEKASETALRDGLAWLGRNFTVRTNPGPNGTMAGPGWHLYYLYAVERAGVLAGVDWMADRDWYGEGADFLCEVQDDEGSWSNATVPVAPRGRGAPRRVRAVVSASGVVDTCFALLFLKKGTMPVRRGALTQSNDDTDIRFEAAATLTGKDFEDFIDLVLQRWRRSTDEGVRQRLFDGATAVGPRIVEPLLVRMDSPDADDRRSAVALLRHATGRTFDFDPAAERAAREDGVMAWQAWWLSAKASLRYDSAAKRLVSD